tara:strand:- start:131 stop:469 length:339 start_codon:yes stop_codon:yes gene_type:complete
MQTTAITGVAAATQDLNSSTLGFDPNPYTHFYIQVLGADTETWEVKVKAPGSSQFATIYGLPSASMAIPGSVALTPDHVANVGELQVAFSGGTPSSATILVAAATFPGLGKR